jgi:hypothetical protein
VTIVLTMYTPEPKRATGIMPGSMDAYHSEWADRDSDFDEYPRVGRSDRALVRRARSNIFSNIPDPDQKVLHVDSNERINCPETRTCLPGCGRQQYAAKRVDKY